MYLRFNFLKIFRGKQFRWSIHAIIFIFLLFLFAAGCNDSDPGSGDDPGTDTPLTDAEWIAFQDGDGPWQEIEIPETGIFIPTVTDSEGRYGLAYLLADAADQRVVMQTILTTTTELPQIDVSAVLEGNSINFQVTVEEPQNLADSTVNIYVGDDEAAVSSGFTYTRTFSKTPGTYDLFVTQSTSGVAYPTNYIARRNIDLTTSAAEETISTANFNSITALTGPYTVTVQGTDSELDSSVYRGGVELITTNLTEAELGYKSTADASLQYSALDTPLTGDDIYLAYLDIELEDNDDVYYDASYYEGFLDAGDITLSPLMVNFDVTFDFNTDTGNTLPGISGIPSIGTGVVLGYMLSYQGSVEDGIEYYTVSYVSAGRVGDATSISMPDLSSSEGWSDNWSVPDDITTENVQASVNIGPDSSIFRTMANWFSNDVVRFEDGEWFAVLRKSVTYNSQAL